MKRNTDPEAIQAYFEDQVERDATEERLAFDPATGELLLVDASREHNPDAIVVDSITRDGFFALRGRLAA